MSRRYFTTSWAWMPPTTEDTVGVVGVPASAAAPRASREHDADAGCRPSRPAHRALVAGGRGGENHGRAREHPEARRRTTAGRPACGPCWEDAGLAVVQRPRDDVGPADPAEPQIAQDVRPLSALPCSRGRFPGRRRGGRGLEAAAVGPAGTAPSAEVRLVSTRSKSATATCPTPRRARFFSTSFPSAPTPTTSTFAAASFAWLHQGIDSNRRKRWSSRRRGPCSSTRQDPAVISGAGDAHRRPPADALGERCSESSCRPEARWWSL